MNCTDIKDKKDCCGCRNCENICPKKAIKMKEDQEGFLYPQIDKNLCVECGLCKNVCPIINEIDRKNYYETPICYAAKAKDKEIQHNSTSGGMFAIFANQILESNGIVVGCEMDEKHNVKHIIVNQKKDLYKIMGSKYVISDLSEICKKVQEELNKNVKVLFSGTPCQIASLYKFLNKKYDNLYTIEVICHGVPSQKLFDKYIKFLENKYNAKILEYKFRSKKAAKWGTFKAFAKFEKNKTKYFIKKINADFDPYYWSFLNSKNYRESCYSCKYAQPQRNADITIGDFWGIENILPNMIDYNGVSALIINSEKGLELYNSQKDKLIVQEVKYEEIQKNNGQLREPAKRPKERDLWYKNFNDDDFIKNIKIKTNLKSYIKIFFPQKLKLIIKKIINK